MVLTSRGKYSTSCEQEVTEDDDFSETGFIGRKINEISLHQRKHLSGFILSSSQSDRILVSPRNLSVTNEQVANIFG